MRLSDAPDHRHGPAGWAETCAILVLKTGMSHSTLPDDPDCSPHPLDVLAVYALYQQESGG